MKKIILFGIVALCVGVFAVSMLFGPASDGTMTQNTSGVEISQNETFQTETEEITGQASLRSLIIQTEPVECRVIYNPGNQTGAIEGTVFIASERLRADFVTNSPDFGEFVSSYVVDGDTVYSWAVIEGEGYGVELTRQDFENTETTDVPVSYSDVVQYTCTPWRNVDNSIFARPGNVLFRNAEALQDAGMEYGTVYEEGEF